MEKVTGEQVASEPKKDLFFARRSGFLQAIVALWSKKIAKYGGKWDFLGQTAILPASYWKNIVGKLALSVNIQTFAPRVFFAPLYCVSLIQEQSNNRGNLGFPVCSPPVPAGDGRLDCPIGH
ncbi:MAG: hypothetical protein ACR2K1_10380 [Saprospiraceae bacterium]